MCWSPARPCSRAKPAATATISTPSARRHAGRWRRKGRDRQMDMIMDMLRTASVPRDERLAMPRGALFDLDGTLIDSVPDITAAVAELLASEQLPPLSEDQVRMMVGRGLKVLERK